MGTTIDSRIRNERRNPDLLKEGDIKAWANVPREVVLYKMTGETCFEEKVYYALILLSWCGPHVSEACVVKDAQGRIVRDAAGNPLPAKQKDIRKALGLAPSSKGNLCRTIKNLHQQGLVRVNEVGVMYPV